MYIKSMPLHAIICLSLLFSACNLFADSWDPGDNTSAGATPLTNFLTTTQTHGPHDIVQSQNDTEDWFSIDMVAGGTYYLESTGPDDMSGFLYSDPNGTNQVNDSTADDDQGEGLNFKIVFMPTVSGTYYLKVTPYAPIAQVDYDLLYRMDPPVLDDWDPEDDSGAGATYLTNSTALQSHGPHVLTEVDANDWFRFSLVAGETYRFESVLNNQSFEDIDAVLYSDSSGIGQVTFHNDLSISNNNFRIVYSPTANGDYYLKVEWVSGAPAGYSLEYVQLPPDADGDGLPDSWEIQYFGSTNALPNAHGDTDSFTNYEEYIAGTDPTNAASYFAITNWSAGSLILEWPAFSNRQYQVYRTDSMTNSFSPVGPVILYPQNSYTGSITEAGGFYKVEVQLQ